jgi:ketosteroid isomerase-like protein
VNYADATDNNDVLSKLSGYQSGSGSIPVDPAFAALRSARDQYGADLVSLVRRFRTPENKGCGVAWLIGGDQSRIDNSDAPWGYSVVSDDLDRGDLDETDSKTYVCRKETLAHELGHNMGQAHNSEDSDGTPGAHSYSYGYREASATGFYTVMAYRLADSSQKSIRYFANPNVLDPGTGRPSGVAYASDNARSMAQTLPLIATFRATLTPIRSAARSDIDGDGGSDLLWYRPADGLLAYWVMNGTTVTRHGSVPVGGDFRIVATGDFNGDGRLDLIWNRPQGDMQIWTGDGADFAQRQFLAMYPTGWTLLGAGDIDGDGRSDLVWYRATDGRLAYWIMNGPQIVRHGDILVGGDFRVIAMEDFNGDGRLDLVWNRPAGDMQFWAGDGAGFAQRQAFAAYPTGWQLVGPVDINGDAQSDLVWYRPADGRVAYWLMSGAAVTGHGDILVGGEYRLLALRDFNGDRMGDFIWNRPAGDMQMWIGDGNRFSQRGYFTSYPTGWQLIPTGG